MEQYIILITQQLNNVHAILCKRGNMCIFNKWRKFTPTQKYLDTVKYIKML